MLVKDRPVVEQTQETSHLSSLHAADLVKNARKGPPGLSESQNEVEHEQAHETNISLVLTQILRKLPLWSVRGAYKEYLVNNF